MVAVCMKWHLTKAQATTQITYLNHLDILWHANIKNGNITTHTLLAILEYCIHVAILFNEILINKEIGWDEKTTDECKELAHGLMQYFEDWKIETDDLLTASNNQAKQQQINKCVMSMVIYNNLCTSYWIFLYAQSVLRHVHDNSPSGLFVPVLHSNTSLLKAWFSLVHSNQKDTSCNYITAVSTLYAGAEVQVICNSRNKSYSENDIVAPEDEQGATALEQALGRKDSWRQKTVSDIISTITMEQCTNESQSQSWLPFLENSESEHQMNANKTQIGMELCQVILLSQFVGVNHFLDIIFPSNTTLAVHDSEMYLCIKNYFEMCIGTPSSGFFHALCCLNNGGKKDLMMHAACFSEHSCQVSEMNLPKRQKVRWLTHLTI